MKKPFDHIVGIDPGIGRGQPGGIVLFNRYSGQYSTWKMPSTERMLEELLRSVFCSGHFLVGVERVGFHVNGHNPQSSCKLAAHAGYLRGALSILPSVSQVEIVEDTHWKLLIPRKPQRPSPRETDYAQKLSAYKRRVLLAVRDEMTHRFPDVRVFHWNAAALAILAVTGMRHGIDPRAQATSKAARS